MNLWKSMRIAFASYLGWYPMEVKRTSDILRIFPVFLLFLNQSPFNNLVLQHLSTLSLIWGIISHYSLERPIWIGNHLSFAIQWLFSSPLKFIKIWKWKSKISYCLIKLIFLHQLLHSCSWFFEFCTFGLIVLFD